MIIIDFYVPILLGILLGFAFVKFFQANRSTMAIGLTLAALIYVGFAAVNHPAGLTVELGGLLLYGAVAWAGLRKSALWLAVGWALHVLWDALLHLDGTGALYTPTWYVYACIGFDLIVGWMIWQHYRNATPQPAVT